MNKSISVIPPEVACRRAAVYVRMSTDRQNYSIVHQTTKIREYASTHHFEIVHTYVDEGKSGIDIKGRVGLRSLLADVVSGRADFDTVLVYDVSRWGRFQDVDESAHYEYICRQAGVKIAYCVEQFENDNSPLAALLKSIKRTMAAEYSRELSAKVFAAQCHFTELGFKQGGTAGYGLRRVAVSASGANDRTLLFGDSKGAITDRVVFGLGPDEEVAVVRQIYHLYVTAKLSQTEIAARLNAANLPNEFGRSWTLAGVKSILTNEKYIGNLVFNRRSFKLKKAIIRNPPEMWVRPATSFAAIVTPKLFERAQKEREARLARWTPAELINALEALYAKHGAVNARLLAEEGLPNAKLFGKHFGSLGRAYLLAGIPRTRFSKCGETKHAVHAVFKTTVADVMGLIARAGAGAVEGASKGTIVINGNVRLKIAAIRSRHEWGRVKWKLPIATVPQSDFILCVLLDHANVTAARQYLLPVSDFVEPWVLLKDHFADALEAYRYDSLNAMFGFES